MWIYIYIILVSVCVCARAGVPVCPDERDWKKTREKKGAERDGDTTRELRPEVSGVTCRR